MPCQFAQDSGTRADVTWNVRDGGYKVVVMNADGSREVKADSHFEAGADHLSTVALSAMLLGLMVLGGGGVLTRRRDLLVDDECPRIPPGCGGLVWFVVRAAPGQLHAHLKT